jgi:hypothetical protein
LLFHLDPSLCCPLHDSQHPLPLPASRHRGCFRPAHSTVDFSLTDQGKIFCCSIPQRFDAERGFLNTLMKIAWYSHIKNRFNLSEEELAHRNLNVLWADEAQRVVTKSELGMADHNQVDQVREAKGLLVHESRETPIFEFEASAGASPRRGSGVVFGIFSPRNPAPNEGTLIEAAREIEFMRNQGLFTHAIAQASRG